jgi:GxxExxY protein
MNEEMPDLSGQVIGAAIRVHKTLGPGFLEPVYEESLCLELLEQGIVCERQLPVVIYYRERPVGEHRLDVVVGRRIVVELKSVTAFDPIHFATLRSYLKATNLTLGLLLNFASSTLQVKRVGREWHRRAD